MLSTPLLAASPRPVALRPWLLASALALAVVALLAGISVAPAHAAKAKAKVAKLTITGVKVANTSTDPKITVTGRVTLPVNTAKERKRAEVYLTLVSGTGKTAKTEKFDAKLTSKDRFTVTHATKLSGALGLDVLVKIAGKQSGKTVVKTISVPASSSKSTGVTTPGSTTPGGTTPGSTTPGGTTPGSTIPGGSTPGSPGSPSSPSSGGTVLNGTFEIQAGAQAVSGALTGTYFQMFGVSNNSSPLLNQNYTPLSPGTDGGLETYGYQEPPTPAFAGGNTGNALASRIVQPQAFFGINFSIVTAPTDPQAGLPDPLPQIIDTNGTLSGQITDWNAQWNGESFNQGSPKSDGQYPSRGASSIWGVSGTIPLQGTYDAATGHYVLEWQSLIEGGPFGGFTGYWHLEGTFVPQA